MAGRQKEQSGEPLRIMTPSYPKSRLAPAMIVAGTILALVLAYPAFYLFGCDTQYVHAPYKLTKRTFRWEWQAMMYQRLAQKEAEWTGYGVETSYGLGQPTIVDYFDP